MRLKHKAWFFGGAALGLAIPIAIRVYERVLMLGEVPPVVRWLLWPTSIIRDFSYPSTETGELILSTLILLSNAFLYGFLAKVLRRASIGIAALLLVAVWIALPPSDNTLVKRFGKHRAELEQLIQMANHDAHFIEIRPSLLKTVDGKEYGLHDAQSVLSETRWAEYRRLFKAVGLNEGLYRSEKTGDVFLSAHTFGKTDTVATYFGYLFCPDITGRPSSFLPCMKGSASADERTYRWKKLDSEWYIFEVRVHGIENHGKMGFPSWESPSLRMEAATLYSSAHG